LALDYRLWPVAFAGHDLADVASHRLQVGDRFTVVTELNDLERLIQRKAIPTTASVVLDDYPVTAKEALATLVQAIRHCTLEEAEVTLNEKSFTLATGLTRGEAQELVERLAREKATARVLVLGEWGMYSET
jgi:hypothetical protein